MTDVKMRANDTLFISAWSPDNIPPDGEFEVSEARAAELEAAGLARRAGGRKAEAAPANKQANAPTNKAKAPAKKKGD